MDGWGGVSVREVFDAGRHEIDDAPTEDLRIVVVTAGTYAVESARPHGRWERALMAPGRSAVTPAGREIRARWSGAEGQDLRSVHVAIPGATVEETIAELPEYAGRPLNRLSRDDPYTHAAALALRDAGRRGAPALVAQSIAVSMVAHLLSLPTPSRASAPGLSAEQLALVIEEMRSRLDDPPSLAELAARVPMSRYHFLRRFTATAGSTPMRVLTGLRMERARGLLRDRERSVAAVAFACGYSTPAAFAAAFRRHHGASPGEFRRAQG